MKRASIMMTATRRGEASLAWQASTWHSMLHMHSAGSESARGELPSPDMKARAFEAANPLIVEPPPHPSVPTPLVSMPAEQLDDGSALGSLPPGGRAEFVTTALDPLRPVPYIATRAICVGDSIADREASAARPLARRQLTRKVTSGGV